jgi:hypothetical protein
MGTLRQSLFTGAVFLLVAGAAAAQDTLRPA